MQKAEPRVLIARIEAREAKHGRELVLLRGLVEETPGLVLKMLDHLEAKDAQEDES